MTWTNSKIFSSYITDALNNTTAFAAGSDTIKTTLFNTTTTPDQTVASASTAYTAGQWTTTNEVHDSAGWIAGGLALASKSSTFTTNVYTFTAANTANGSASTLSGAFGCLVYDNTLTTPVANQGMCFNYFGGSASVTSGTLTIVWNGSGIFTLTL